ncbi:MAG: hypothetical protein MUC88_14290 [Planctomycetes bacterium]|jgi:hypothetical protein|nr:hypothetical protein [Planctomycetota bacterium]
MTSAAQVQANRANAQKSTGPRTPEGKAIVARNAVQHGLLAWQVVTAGEGPGEFEFYRNQMLGELAPVGRVEMALAQRVVHLSWRLQRAERLQAAAFDKLQGRSEEAARAIAWWAGLSREEQAALQAAAPRDDPGVEYAASLRVVADFTKTRLLDRLLVYERRIEHSFYRSLAELEKRQLRRQMGEPAEAVDAGDEPLALARDREGPGSVPEVGRGRPTLDRVEGRLYEELPQGGTSNGEVASADATTNEGQARQTNPMGDGAQEGQVLCGTEVRGDSGEDGLGETKPMCAGQPAVSVGGMTQM